MKQSWKAAFTDRNFTLKLIGALAVFLIFPFKADDYFQWIQLREGIQWNDPLLNFLPALNVSYPIFGIIYFSVIYLLYRLLQDPKKFLWFAWAFNIETAFRFLSIYLVALNPPTGLVDLHDPLAEIFIYGENMAITKDLFFSGHTATMVFVCYFLPTARERRIAIGLSIILVTLLLIQHVHYSLDIAAAPVFTLAAIWIVKKAGII
ncbi:phosphatase PAP2-related protein [Aquirufa sp.]|uniref:phosphatase PAP2-related protein n=1 Tax=Aquirufa sp. TaxID=2676249 RepID=UPI003784E1FF